MVDSEYGAGERSFFLPLASSLPFGSQVQPATNWPPKGDLPYAGRCSVQLLEENCSPDVLQQDLHHSDLWSCGISSGCYVREGGNYPLADMPSSSHYTEHVQLERNMFHYAPFSCFSNHAIEGCVSNYATEPGHPLQYSGPEPDMHGSYRQLAYRVFEEMQLEETIHLEV